MAQIQAAHSLEGLLRDFTEQLEIFLEELTDQFPDEPELLLLNVFLLRNLNMKLVILGFAYYVGPWKNKIKVRDEKFLHGKDLWQALGGLEDQSKRFMTIWSHPDTNQETKDMIWEFIRTLVLLSLRYRNVFLQEIKGALYRKIEDLCSRCQIDLVIECVNDKLCTIDEEKLNPVKTVRIDIVTSITPEVSKGRLANERAIRAQPDTRIVTAIFS